MPTPTSFGTGDSLPGPKVNMPSIGIGSSISNTMSKGFDAFNKGINIGGNMANKAMGLTKTVTQPMMDISTLKNNNILWSDPSKVESMDRLIKWFDYNKNSPLAQSLMKRPDVQQLMQNRNSTMSNVARYGAPLLHNITKNPSFFASLVNMPGVSSITHPFLQMAGAPGMVLLHSILNGNMSDWNTLTNNRFTTQK